MSAQCVYGTVNTQGFVGRIFFMRHINFFIHSFIRYSFIRSELRRCVKVEVAVLGSPSLISPMVSADVKHHERRRSGRDATRKRTEQSIRPLWR